MLAVFVLIVVAAIAAAVVVVTKAIAWPPAVVTAAVVQPTFRLQALSRWQQGSALVLQ